jgi:hypothetical protein
MSSDNTNLEDSHLSIIDSVSGILIYCPININKTDKIISGKYQDGDQCTITVKCINNSHSYRMTIETPNPE